MRTRSARTVVAISALVALVVGACSDGDPEAKPPLDLDGARPIATLSSFDSCDDLLAELKDIAAEKVGPYGFEGGGGRFTEVGARIEGDVATTVAASDQASGAPEASDGMSEGTDYSGTNNQEVGVDEADTVKTDGTRMFVLRGDTLTVIDTTDPAAPRRTARLDLVPGDDESGYVGGGSMMLDGDTVLVLLDRWVAGTNETGGSPSKGAPEDEAIGMRAPDGTQVTEIVSVSVADVAAPKVQDRLQVEGSVAGARLVDGTARVVVRSTPLGFSWVYPQGPEGEDAATGANRQIIAESTIDDWLPVLARDGEVSPAVDCTDVFTPPTFAGLGMVAVHSIPVGPSVEPRSVGLLAQSETVYSSTDSLYVTAAEWIDPAAYDEPDAWDELAASYRTDIHQFDITGPQATYAASGQVRGHPLNQYALSEQDGLLRIATTDGPPFARPMPVDTVTADGDTPVASEEPSEGGGSSGTAAPEPAPDPVAEDEPSVAPTPETIVADPEEPTTTVPDTTVPDTTVPDGTTTTTEPESTTTTSTSTTTSTTTTTTEPTPTTAPGDDLETSESFITVLRPNGDVLEQVGQAGGMGKGEMIRSVRFMGDVAYVVTFRQTDPFYVVDLSTPESPRVVGELKIPGYSGYLHPVGEGRVLGVGADATEDGRITGAKVSLFDVSDPAAPKELSVWGMEGGSTDVEFDAKAFLWWDPTDLAVIPVNGWGGVIAEARGPVAPGEPSTTIPPTGAIGLRVTPEGIEQVGVASHDRTADKGATECRTVTAEEIEGAGFGDYLGSGGDMVVIACAEGQAVAVTGYSCSEYDRQMLEDMGASGEIDLPEDVTIGVCYPDPVPTVQRSVVIGERLITITERDLLSSDLATLAPGPFVDL